MPKEQHDLNLDNLFLIDVVENEMYQSAGNVPRPTHSSQENLYAKPVKKTAQVTVEGGDIYAVVQKGKNKGMLIATNLQKHPEEFQIEASSVCLFLETRF